MNCEFCKRPCQERRVIVRHFQHNKRVPSAYEKLLQTLAEACPRFEGKHHDAA
jgi:hypothetical protein